MNTKSKSKAKDQDQGSKAAIALPYVGNVVYTIKALTSPATRVLYPLTALIGPVESGKTTLLDAIRLGLVPEVREPKLLTPLLNRDGKATVEVASYTLLESGRTASKIVGSVSATRESSRKWDVRVEQDEDAIRWIPSLTLGGAMHLGPDLLYRAIFRRFGLVKGDPIERTAKALVTSQEKSAMVKILTPKRADGSAIPLPEDPAEALVTLIERADASMRESAGVGRRLAEEAKRAKGEAIGHEDKKAEKKAGKPAPRIDAVAALEVLKSPDGHKLCPNCVKLLDRAATAASPTEIARGAYRDVETTTRLAREAEVEHGAFESIKKLLKAELTAAEEATFERAELEVNKHLPDRLRAKVVRVERGIRWGLEVRQRGDKASTLVDLASLSGWEKGSLAIAIPLAFADADRAPIILLDDDDLAGCSVFEIRQLLSQLALRQKSGLVRQVIVTRHDDRASEIPHEYSVVRFGV